MRLASRPAARGRPLSLGVIFLTLYIDLIGFSIIFQLGPDLIRHYLELEGNGGLVGWVVTQLLGLARSLGIDSYPEVLFGGVLSSVFSILQFVFSPFWGSVSDRRGRRSVLELYRRAAVRLLLTCDHVRPQRVDLFGLEQTAPRRHAVHAIGDRVAKARRIVLRERHQIERTFRILHAHAVARRAVTRE